MLFIAVDDLNDWIGCLGGHPQAQTPNIDRLAARGTLFTNAHCQAPLCNPSRTSVLTGLRPSTTGVYALEPWFRTVEKLRTVVALPQYFAANGYHTASGGKIWHGGYPPKNERSTEFNTWGPPASVGVRPPHKLVETPGGNHGLVDWGTFPHRDEDKGDWQLASWGVEQIDSLPRDKPWFLAVGFFLPHVPCYATQKWFDMYPADTTKLPDVKPDDRDDLPRFADYMNWRLPEPRLTWLKEHEQWLPLVRAYLASTSFMDSQVGRLLDAVDASPAADNTIIVLWSDHGWHIGEKGCTGKTTLWQRSTHVPLIFAGPGVAKQAQCTQPAELLDMYPTLAELCGLPAPPSVEGHSLVPQLVDASRERPWPAITTHGPGNHAIRTERWRYIRYADGDEELYDTVADPDEWNNVADDSRHSSIKSELGQWPSQNNAAPAPGSKSRLIDIRDDGKPYWENVPIDPEASWDAYD
ncbi:MAG TPA: sulfatase [Pirellulales bacterium]|nr:sulfatase [Pirellulales bacterium]